jgi:predicted nucleic acid-binding protein
MMWIVDSSVWVDYFNGLISPYTDALDTALGKRELGIGDLILWEVLPGFREQREFERVRAALLHLPVYPMVGHDLALKSIDNYRALRRKGITVRKTIDCLIATFVIEQKLMLLHSDRDFDPFEQHLGLNVVHP